MPGVEICIDELPWTTYTDYSYVSTDRTGNVLKLKKPTVKTKKMADI